MWDFPNFYTSISTNCGECQMQFMSSGFNNIQNEWFNSCANVNSSKDANFFTNPFKYKCKVLNCCVFQYILISAICNSWIMVSISAKWVIRLM